MKNQVVLRALFIGVGALSLMPFVSGPLALFAGIAFALVLGNPIAAMTKKATPVLLQASIVGLGAGMNLAVVGRVGAQGFAYTAVGIGLTLLVGWGLGKFGRVDRETSILISVGTAICGGSAIAAVAPVIRAKNQSVSIALATVFILNAAALFIFPWLGHIIGLGQRQFGLLAALAVHDTSSVVGTALQYGPEALQIATTVKLARALWIVPVTIAIGLIAQPASNPNRSAVGVVAAKPKRPWFILGFLVAAALVTWVPELRETGEWVAAGARRALVLTLFLIGSGLSRATVQSVGPRPFAQGVVLWILVIAATLSGIALGWIS